MRFLRKMKWSKNKIFTVSMIVLVFVMSLGYAALSQFIEIDGIAMVDRSWIVKVTNVTSSATGSGIDKSHSYASTTATMNAVIPNKESTVTYTITLQNQGNLVAKLSMIDRIEDDNTGITYTISGVTEGETILKPGQTNTVLVTIKYSEGVTNVGNIDKSLMLTFNYVEDSQQSIIGGNTVTVGTNNKEYNAGDYVTLVNGTRWYVLKDTGSNEELVTLISDDYLPEIAFDTTGSVNYNPNSSTNIAYYIDNTYIPSIAMSVMNYSPFGGNATGITGRLVTSDEVMSFLQLYAEGKIDPYLPYAFWTMTSADESSVYAFRNGAITPVSATESIRIKPVITILKSNILPKELGNRVIATNVSYADNVASAYVSNATGIDFSQAASDTNGKGLYYTSTNTEDNKKTYYFRGDVDNNYVSFGKTNVEKFVCMYNGEEITHYDGVTELDEGTCAHVCKLSDGKYVTGGYFPDWFCTDNLGGTYMGAVASRQTVYVEESRLWRVVRINEDGSVRLITADTVGETSFNSSAGDNAYVGYMYGTPGSASYSDTHKNAKNSIIKTYLDNWYNSNLSSYSSYLADAGFCNDRSVAPTAGVWAEFDTALGYGTNDTSYGLTGRGNQPQFKCPQNNDLFTLASSSKGNKSLTYPVGLLTIDEVRYAGLSNTYLNNDTYWWTMTPDLYYGIGPGAAVKFFANGINGGPVASDLGVRPVINLNSNVIIEENGANGTISNPYVIK
ncbi:MAG: hypothetical protein IJO43_04145 [Bacilli bacterium]|nr:hypothetical protein [Bacilli bacterium]